MHIHLRDETTSIVFLFVDDTISVAHWGRKLSDLNDEALASVTNRPIPHGGLDVNHRNLLLREHSRGWIGRPSLQGHRNGSAVSNWFVLKDHSSSESEFTAKFEDALAMLQIEVTYKLHASSVLTIDSKVTNIGKGDYTVNQFLNWLPLPTQANEVMDFGGRWAKERQMQRHEMNFGLSTRESFEGRSGLNHTILQLALNNSTNFNSGEAWSMGMAWSGNNIYHVEKLVDNNRSIGAGELLLPGEMILKQGESYEAPSTIATYSANGLDGITNNHYSYIRGKHPKKPRPLILNTWEAIHFDHSFDRIKRIVDKAAEVGVERVVLDDGWFGSRRNDRSGLGDWVVSNEVWPDGLKPLADYINSKGMEFGLWFEGEMIQVDSQTYREHPDWILQETGRMPIEGRRQQVLDITKTDAFAHVLNQVDRVLKSCNIVYIKWDHNRQLSDPISSGHPAVHNQTIAIYKLFEELKKLNPGLEIESCASGGGRIDLGMVEHVDRFWTSDQNDALERQSIQLWTAMAIPPEMLGTHVGPTVSMQTGRHNEISFRVINALFGHAGIEWDITKATEDEIGTLKEFAKFYKENRNVLHTGKLVRSDEVQGRAQLYGTVAQDKSQAIFSYMQLQTVDNFQPTVAKFPGLDENSDYRLEVVTALSSKEFEQRRAPSWWPSVQLRADALAEMGVEMPILRPEQGLLIKLTKI